MILEVLKQFIICLIITIVIEYIPIVIFLEIPRKYFVAVNVLTNVVANAVVLIYDILDVKRYGVMSRGQLFVVLEVAVCIVEIVLYYKYWNKRDGDNYCQNFIKIVFLTIFANVISVLLGNVILKNM